MPARITQKVIERKQAILRLLADGCKPTSYIIKALDTTHTEAFYALKALAKEGYIKKAKFGKAAIWCLNDEDYNQLVNTLLREIRRIVESHNLKYVYPMRLYRLILKDFKTYKLLSRLVPMGTRNSSALSFLNHLLSMLYGEPYIKGEKTVYKTTKAIESRPEPAA
jgi:hypothetical protein